MAEKSKELTLIEKIHSPWEIVCKAVWLKYKMPWSGNEVTERLAEMTVTPTNIEFVKIKSSKKWMVQQYALVIQNFDFERRILFHTERPLYTSLDFLMQIREKSQYVDDCVREVDYIKKFTGIEKEIVRRWMARAHESGLQTIQRICSELTVNQPTY